jgi:tRNA A37 threonylcarbamoyltransferase TsaD
LRRRLPEWAREKNVELRLVPLAYAGDNAAMIAHAALLKHAWGHEDDPLSADAASRIPL